MTIAMMIMNTDRTLAEVVADPAFYRRVAALAVRVSQGRDEAEVSAAMEEACLLFGADAAAFASFMQDDEAYESYRFILACDPLWCLEYEGGACYMHDPWLDYVRHHAEPMLVGRLPARSGPGKAVEALAQGYGFASGVVVPAPAVQGLTRVGALVLGSHSPEYFNEDTLPAVAFAATGLAHSFHAWQVARLREEVLGRVRLSPDDIELIEFERRGLGSKEVARIKAATSQAVDSRWQRLNSKLGVSSRAAAARLAAEYGLV
jgi:DNA-binding CsgD family transcriptional regulator